MKKFLAQSIALLLVIGGLLIFFSPTNSSTRLDIPFLPQNNTTSKLEINGTVFNVEIADSESRRNKGLSNRESLATNSGMLFVFPKPDKYAFWMKGMKIPLDFIWIKDLKIVDLLVHIQPPKDGEKDESLPVYSSKQEFNKVLEVNAGTIARLNIKVGDIIKMP